MTLLVAVFKVNSCSRPKMWSELEPRERCSKVSHIQLWFPLFILYTVPECFLSVIDCRWLKTTVHYLHSCFEKYSLWIYPQPMFAFMLHVPSFSSCHSQFVPKQVDVIMFLFGCLSDPACIIIPLSRNQWSVWNANVSLLHRHLSYFPSVLNQFSVWCCDIWRINIIVTYHTKGTVRLQHI